MELDIELIALKVCLKPVIVLDSLVNQSKDTLGQTYKCAVELNEIISLFKNKITPKSRNTRLYMMFVK